MRTSMTPDELERLRRMQASIESTRAGEGCVSFILIGLCVCIALVVLLTIVESVK